MLSRQQFLRYDAQQSSPALPIEAQAQAPIKPRPSLWVLVFRLGLLILLAVVMAVAFLFFGEEAPDAVVRPLVTAQQRAQAFRL